MEIKGEIVGIDLPLDSVKVTESLSPDPDRGHAQFTGQWAPAARTYKRHGNQGSPCGTFFIGLDRIRSPFGCGSGGKLHCVLFLTAHLSTTTSTMAVCTELLHGVNSPRHRPIPRRALRKDSSLCTEALRPR